MSAMGATPSDPSPSDPSSSGEVLDQSGEVVDQDDPHNPVGRQRGWEPVREHGFGTELGQVPLRRPPNPIGPFISGVVPKKRLEWPILIVVMVLAAIIMTAWCLAGFAIASRSGRTHAGGPTTVNSGTVAAAIAPPADSGHVTAIGASS